MPDIFALIEHRQGVIRDISYELLACARSLAEKKGVNASAVLLGHNTEKMVDSLKNQIPRIIVVDNKLFENFNVDTYQPVLTEIIKKEQPFITLLGHTAFGMDLGPALGTQLALPFTTDCLDIKIEDNKVRVIRQMFDGKLNAQVLLEDNPSYLLTLRSGTFPATPAQLNAEVQVIESPITKEPELRRFLEYIEAAAGEVDITKADIIVAVGRGIKEPANIPLIEEFVRSIGGVVACSRPIVDAGWLPKERQVGSSGKTVKPKLYIALGISGASQHIAGMKNSACIVAVNKDPNAPIFNEAHYGIVDDLFKVIPALKNKIMELKG